MDKLLRAEHEDYCGIVYADDLRAPGFIKIYDPNNLGVSCGYSDNPPLPGWIMSRLPPVDLSATPGTGSGSPVLVATTLYPDRHFRPLTAVENGGPSRERVMESTKPAVVIDL